MLFPTFARVIDTQRAGKAPLSDLSGQALLVVSV